MLRVYKYPVPVDDYFSLELPRGAKILTIQTQHNEPQIWALVVPANSIETRKFRLSGTGHPIDEREEDLDYIGTFQIMNGALIFHCFEIREKK